MIQTTKKCYCDNCNEEMNKLDYDIAPKVTLRVSMGNPKGGCGQVSGIEMVLCDKCARDIGIQNKTEYHSYIDSQNRLTYAIKNCKSNLLKLFRKNS